MGFDQYLKEAYFSYLAPVGKGLQIEFTVEDPNVFNTPWSGTATYSKADDLWVENVCAENTHEYYANRDAAIPTDDRPDF